MYKDLVYKFRFKWHDLDRYRLKFSVFVVKAQSAALVAIDKKMFQQKYSGLLLSQ